MAEQLQPAPEVKAQKKPRNSRRRSKVFAITAAALASLGLLSGAFVGGWAAANTLVIAPQDRPQAEVSVVTLPDASMRGAARMPDVRGMAQATAAQAIVDAGIAASVITVSERPAAGAAGRVIEQVPAFGSLNPALVSIVISVEASIPEVAGLSAIEAISQLQALGARVEQKREFDPRAVVGNAVRTIPEAGSALPEVVTLFIAENAAEMPLNDLDDNSIYWRTDVLFEGKSYDYSNSFYTSRPSYARDYSWRLHGGAQSLTGSYAFDSGHQSNYAGYFVVYGDGVRLAKLKASGTVQDFAIDVSGVDTLVIRAEHPDSGVSGSIVMLNPVVVGSYDKLKGTQ